MTTQHVYPMDITGYTFGRLKVRKLSAKRDAQGNRLWLCDCECGGSKYVSRVHLRRGQVMSCGCAQAEQRSIAMQTHREAQEDAKELRAVLQDTRKRLAEAQAEIAYLRKHQRIEPVSAPWARGGIVVPEPFEAVYD